MSKKPQLSDINWEQIPHRFNYVAIDSDGDAFAYETEPRLDYVGGIEAWLDSDGNEPLYISDAFKRSDWGSMVSRQGAGDEEETTEGIVYVGDKEIDVVATMVDEDEWEATCEYKPGYIGEGDTAEEAMEDLEDQLIDDAVEDEENTNGNDAQENLDEIVEWFEVNTDVDTDDVDDIITRLDELLAAEDTLLAMVADYQDSHPTLNQDKFVD